VRSRHSALQAKLPVPARYLPKLPAPSHPDHKCLESCLTNPLLPNPAITASINILTSPSTLFPLPAELFGSVVLTANCQVAFERSSAVLAMTETPYSKSDSVSYAMPEVESWCRIATSQSDMSVSVQGGKMRKSSSLEMKCGKD